MAIENGHFRQKYLVVYQENLLRSGDSPPVLFDTAGPVFRGCGMGSSGQGKKKARRGRAFSYMAFVRKN